MKTNTRPVSMIETHGALLALFLLACSGDPMPLDAPTSTACTPGESRACACSSGAMGAQVCEGDGSRLGPCVCAVDDGGFEELDAGVIFEVDAGRRDAGVPVERDAGHDGGPVDAGSTWEGECDLVTQAGCGEDEACRRSRLPGEYDMYTGPPQCEPVPPGARGDWERYPDGCSVYWTDRDLCQRGAFCERAIDVCVRYCDPDGAACPATSDGVETWCNCISFQPDCYCDTWSREAWERLRDGGA